MIIHHRIIMIKLGKLRVSLHLYNILFFGSLFQLFWAFKEPVDDEFVDQCLTDEESKSVSKPSDEGKEAPTVEVPQC